MASSRTWRIRRTDPTNRLVPTPTTDWSRWTVDAVPPRVTPLLPRPPRDDHDHGWETGETLLVALTVRTWVHGHPGGPLQCSTSLGVVRYPSVPLGTTPHTPFVVPENRN